VANQQANYGSSSRSGILFGLAAYGSWGLVPLYFNEMVYGVSPIEILAHRIIWSAVLLSLYLTLFRQWKVLGAVVRDRSKLIRLSCSAFLVAGNWYFYVFSATTGQISQASLGYFILPLVNALVGVTFFAEKLRWGQGLALAFAVLGVTVMTWQLGVLPWLALILAASFAAYGIVRKITPVDALIGLAVETMLLSPVALALLVYWQYTGELHFGKHGLAKDLSIVFSGVITTVPLVCFAAAMRRLPLVTIGFLQYLSPTLQFLLAVLVYREPFGLDRQISYTFIWLGVVIFAGDALMKGQQARALKAKSTRSKEIHSESPKPIGMSQSR
jgi:chloramphenicol-sensitive protein RarD